MTNIHTTNDDLTVSARLATIDQLLETTIPAYLAPPPARETLRDWFDRANIARFKANPLARRGGGQVFYSVAGVEKFLRARAMPKLGMVR